MLFYAFLYDQSASMYRLRLADNVTDRMQGKRGDAGALPRRLRRRARRDRRSRQRRFRFLHGLCDQGPGLLVNERAIPRLTAARVDKIVDLVKRCVPLDAWPASLFEIADNVRRAGALLSEPMRPGSARDAAIALGRQGLLDEMKRSGLRGRGGAGAERFVVCNDTSPDYFAQFGERRANMMGPVDDSGALDFRHGGLRARDADGGEIFDHVDCATYPERLVEEILPWSYMKFPHIRALGA